MRIFSRWTVTTHKVCGCNCKILDNGFCTESLQEETERTHLTYYNPHMNSPDDFLSVMCQLTPHDKWTRHYWDVVKEVFHPTRRILDLSVGLSSFHPSLSMSLDDAGSDKKSRGYGTNCVTYMTHWKKSKDYGENHVEESFKEQRNNYQDENEEVEPHVAECTII